MLNQFTCKTCGSTSCIKKSETEYECQYCGTDFFLKQPEVSAEKIRNEINIAMQQNAHSAQTSFYRSAKTTQRVVLVVTLVLILVGVGFGVYMSQKTMRDADKQREEMLKTQQEIMKDMKLSK
ncbi:MAG: hypothetical protein V4667_11210 [Bacteroidota bacterium]